MDVNNILGSSIILIVFAWIILGIYSGVKHQKISDTVDEIKEWIANKPEEIKENVKGVKILP
jgi:uncharacterized protein YoxC